MKYDKKEKQIKTGQLERDFLIMWANIWRVNRTFVVLGTKRGISHVIWFRKNKDMCLYTVWKEIQKTKIKLIRKDRDF